MNFGLVRYASRMKDLILHGTILRVLLVLGLPVTLAAAYLWGDTLSRYAGWGLMLVVGAPIILFVRRFLRNKAEPETVQPNPRPVMFLLAPIPAAVATVLILAGRYLSFPYPQGTDTPFYAYATSAMMGGRMDLVVGTARESTYLSIIAVRLVVEQLLGLGEVTSFVVMPFVFGVFLVASFAYLVLSVSKDVEITILSSLVLATTGFFIRFTWDLYSAMLSFGCLNIFLGTYFRLQDATPRGRKIAILAGLSFLVVLGSAFTWLVGSFVFFVLWLHQYHVGKKRDLSFPDVLVILALPGVYTLLVSTFVAGLISIPPAWYERSVTPSFSSGFLYAFSSDSHPFALPPTWDIVVSWENAFYVWFGAGSLLYTLLVSTSRLRQVILPWSLSFSALFALTGYPDWYRLVPGFLSMAIGLGLLAWIGETRRWLGRIARPAALRGARIAVPVVVMASVLSPYLAGTWEMPFSTPATWSFPSEEAFNDLLAVRDHVGWGNTSVVVLIHQEPLQTNFAWARAITGTDVFIGNMSAFLARGTFDAAGVRNISIDPCEKTYAVLPRNLYAEYESVQAQATHARFKMVAFSGC